LSFVFAIDIVQMNLEKLVDSGGYNPTYAFISLSDKQNIAR